MRNLYGFALALICVGCSNPVSSTCTPACAEGFMCVDGTCVQGEMPDLLTGGGDGNMGNCNPACGGLTPYCNGAGHCVGCTMDAQCPQGKFCDVKSDTMATCAIGCDGDDRCGGGTMKCCNKRCVDTGQDPGNCGGCGTSCTAPHASAACNAGQCAAGNCDPGWGDCDGDAKNGCEANLHVDPNNCTACGTQCALKNAVPGCSDGCYITACNFGFDDCNQDPKDGCELSVLTDPNNCGGCGNSCAGLPNATANCTAGNCVLGACKPGYANCNGDPMDGCEVNLLADPNNCNGCGNVCPMNAPSCASGVCGTLVTWVGVKQNVPINSLGGWTQCFIDNYADNASNINTLLQKCNGSNLLIGCRPNGAANLTLAAEAARADVLFDCGTNQTCTHVANGVGWYFSSNYSWGFVSGNDPVSRNSCDTQNINPDLRMCWHTGGGNMNSGYRCGNNFLNGNAGWDRLVFTSN